MKKVLSVLLIFFTMALVTACGATKPAAQQLQVQQQQTTVNLQGS